MRKQFLFVEGQTIVAFVTKGEKFADCSSYSEVTARVRCKVREDWRCQLGSGGGKWCTHPIYRWWKGLRGSP